MQSSICSYHGGSEIHDIVNLKQDMSVTTNMFGLLDGYFQSLNSNKFTHLATHYPPFGNDEALHSVYRGFVGETPPPIFGNGASEMIDVIIRKLPSGNWKTNDVVTQYKEYKNACIKTHREQLAPTDLTAKITVIINPNNPTGDFLEWDEMVKWVDSRVGNDSYLIVDESMLFWYGPDWTKHSFLGHSDYVAQLKRDRNISVIVIQSWTKIFSCTGLRIGSAVIYDDELRNQVSEALPPWSLNAIARDYIIYALKPANRDYLEKTWKYTSVWRKQIIHQLSLVYPEFTVYGAPFLSWIWIDTHDEEIAKRIVSESKQIGYPIRHGKQGYNMNTYIRIAVRNPEHIAEWFDMLHKRNLSIVRTNSIRKQLVIENCNLPVGVILKHEHHDEAHANALYNHLVGYNTTIQTIVVCAIPDTDKYLIIDGHHRMIAFGRMGYTHVPVTVIDYFNPIIWTTRGNEISKRDIMDRALRGELMDIKSSKHMIDMGNDIFAPIIILSEYTWTDGRSM
jgi:histidinol-phosphate/aromatic aminotransferase/cobyric acid decarboxylase-like protein